MRQPYMAICDAEEGYAEHLTEYMRQKKGFPFRIGTFRDVETLLEFTKFSKVDMVLLSSEQFDDYQSMAKQKQYRKRCQLGQQTPIEHIVILDHGQGKEFLQYPCIYKYQSVEEIMKELLVYLSNEDVAEHGKNQNVRTKFITFYTPINRCLQTTTAFTYAKLLARTQRVLFLNLEAYSTLEHLLQQEITENLADLLYTVKESNEKFAYRMAAMIMNRENLDILPPMVNLEDLQSVPKEKWLAFFKQIKEMHQYQTVVIDLGEPIQGFLDILSESYRVIQLTREESSAEAVLRKYDQMIEMLDYPYLQEITERIYLPDLNEYARQQNMTNPNPLVDLIQTKIMNEKKKNRDTGQSIQWEEIA